MSDLPTSFGKYYLTEKIAAGGMAEIYLAKLIGPGGFEKQLVIKQIHPELSGERQFVDLFVAEARTLVSLSHGNIVPIYELGVVDHTYFIAMEYIDGPTLAELSRAVRRRGAMEPAVAAYVCAEILKGLDYAHRKGEGVIHRDLSPRNVMVSREGEVKLVDFGIAIALDQQASAPDGRRPAGSYPYMSPEQVRRQPLTGQSDLFSAGVLLWEMLAGEPLFARDTPEATLEAVTDAPVEPPSSRRPALPPALDAACMRALARDPAGRYPTAAAFLAALNRYQYGLAEPVTPADLSRLVARCCPPVARRSADRDPASDAGATTGAPDAMPAPETIPAAVADAGDGTRPLPGRRRDATGVPAPASRPAPTGKRRATTVRTFATHVELERALANATPLLPLPALTDDEPPAPAAGGAARGEGTDAGGAGAAGGGAGAGASGGPGVSATMPPASADRTAPPASADRTAPSRRARPRGLAVAGAGAALAVAAIAAIAFALGRQPRPAAQPHAAALDAGPRGPSTTPRAADHPAPDAALAPPPDAALAPPRSPAAAHAPPRSPAASPLPAPSAAPPTPPPAISRSRPAGAPDAAPRPAHALGTLRVGANPWGEVYLDGRSLGRAPNEWQVPAGPHRVEVRFPVSGREQTRAFAVTIRPGETASVGVVDFTGP